MHGSYPQDRLYCGKCWDQMKCVVYINSNQNYQRPNGRVGGANNAHPNKINFFIVHKASQFIGVDYGDRKGDRRSDEARNG